LRAEVLRLADDPDLRVRFEVALALGEFPGDEAARGLATIARRDAADPWVRTAILSSAIVSPAGLFERLWHDRDFAASPGGLTLLRRLALVVGARSRPEETGRLLEALSGREPDEAGIEVALGFGDGLARAKRRLSDLRKDGSPTATAWLDRLFKDAA